MKGKRGKKSGGLIPAKAKAEQVDGRPASCKPGMRAGGRMVEARADKKKRGGKTKFIQKAIKRPGREKERAARNGVSVHEQMEHDSHSADPSVRGAGMLGLRLSKMAKHKSKS